MWDLGVYNKDQLIFVSHKVSINELIEFGKNKTGYFLGTGK